MGGGFARRAAISCCAITHFVRSAATTFFEIQGEESSDFVKPFDCSHQGYLQNLGTTKRSNMKKNTFKVWKQTFSELDFETLRVKSSGLGISPNARLDWPSGRNKSYSQIEDSAMRCSSTLFLRARQSFLLYNRGELPFGTCLPCATG